MERGNRRFQYFVVSAVCSSSVTVGVSFSWATPVLPMIARHEVGFPISKEGISWMVAISSIGFVIGSFVARVISDNCGRRVTILASSLPMIIGTISIIYAWEAWMLSFGRFLWGVGTGISVAVAAVYVAEIVDKDIRGQLSLTNRFMLSFGCLLVITVGAFVSYLTLNYITLVLPAISFIVCWWIPESPFYLIKKGKFEAAKKNLQMLTGILDEDILEERISQMKSQVKVEMKKKSSLKEFLTGDRYRKAIFIVIGFKVPQIMTGLHAIQNYLATILMESKSGMNITAAVIFFGAIRFLLGVMSSVLVDRLGRRPLLIGSFIGTGTLLTITSVYFHIQTKYGAIYPYSLIPFIFIILSIIVSVLGYESVSYLLPAELFPMNVKSIALAMTSILGGLMNFISVKSYQQVKDWIGFSGLFGTYATAAFSGAVFCYFLVPETKGKSLKEIQIELNGNFYEEEEKLNNMSANEKTLQKVENGNVEEKLHPIYDNSKDEQNEMLTAVNAVNESNSDNVDEKKQINEA